MQLAVRRANLSAVLGALSTIDTLHNTQPTIQLQLTRQEFAAALELISTSRDILGNETANIECLKHLPAQLDELTLVIEKMLLADFESIISSEFDREVDLVKLSECDEEVVRDTKYDECMLSAIISGLVRQQRFKFLEYFEQQAISCLKNVIKDAVLSVLDVTSETTLTNLVAEYAGVASSEDWSSLIDLLHERLGKLVSLRSRPADLALVSPRELEAIGRTIA